MKSIHWLFGAKRLTISGWNRCPAGTPHPQCYQYMDEVRIEKIMIAK
ncbi:hypothetical protein KKE26_05765 [bacterium]|nr:hypothetical protein [bacterium]